MILSFKKSASLCILLGFLMIIDPSYEAGGGEISTPTNPTYPLLLEGLLPTSPIIEELDKAYDTYRKPLKGESDDKSDEEKESENKNKEDKMEGFMKKMLGVQNEKFDKNTFNKDKFIKATFTAYLAAEHLYATFLCRFNDITNGPLKRLPYLIYPVGEDYLEGCLHVGNWLYHITDSYKKALIATDKDNHVMKNEFLNEDDTNIKEIAGETEEPADLEERLLSNSAPDFLYRDGYEAEIEQLLENENLSKSKYSFLKTVRVLVRYISKLHNMLDKLNDVNSMESRLKIFSQNYPFVFDKRLHILKKYLNEYFGKINIDQGPVGLPGSVIADAYGVVDIWEHRGKISNEWRFWRNSINILKMSEAPEMYDATEASSTGITPLKLLALCEYYRNKDIYLIQGQFPEVSAVEMSDSFKYPDVEIAWNAKEENQPDFSFVAKT